MADIYLNPTLIDFSYFAAYSPVPTNFNWDDIRPFVSIAEEVWVVDIVGRKLYNELLEQVSSNTLTGENSTLLLKIYPYLSMAIVYESMPFLAYSITEKGIQKVNLIIVIVLQTVSYLICRTTLEHNLKY